MLRTGDIVTYLLQSLNDVQRICAVNVQTLWIKLVVQTPGFYGPADVHTPVKVNDGLEDGPEDARSPRATDGQVE